MTRDEALAAFNAARVRGLAAVAAMPLDDAVDAIYYPGHPLGSRKAVRAELIARRQRHQQATEQDPAA